MPENEPPPPTLWKTVLDRMIAQGVGLVRGALVGTSDPNDVAGAKIGTVVMAAAPFAGLFDQASAIRLFSSDEAGALLRPLHSVEPPKVKSLAASMRATGWRGRPLLGLAEDDGSVQLLTGTHRLAAAQETQTDVPVLLFTRHELDAPMSGHRTAGLDTGNLYANLHDEPRVSPDVLSLAAAEEIANGDRAFQSLPSPIRARVTRLLR